MRFLVELKCINLIVESKNLTCSVFLFNFKNILHLLKMIVKCTNCIYKLRHKIWCKSGLTVCYSDCLHLLVPDVNIVGDTDFVYITKSSLLSFAALHFVLNS